MDSIYSHAELTISPVASSSVSDSLIRPRIMRMTRPLALDLMWQPKRFRKCGRRFVIFAPDFDDKAGYEQGPVHSRGWTLQEQLLSSRILWFAEGMLHYQCLLRYHKEVTPRGCSQASHRKQGDSCPCSRQKEPSRMFWTRQMLFRQFDTRPKDPLSYGNANWKNSPGDI